MRIDISSGHVSEHISLKCNDRTSAQRQRSKPTSKNLNLKNKPLEHKMLFLISHAKPKFNIPYWVEIEIENETLFFFFFSP